MRSDRGPAEPREAVTPGDDLGDDLQRALARRAAVVRAAAPAAVRSAIDGRIDHRAARRRRRRAAGAVVAAAAVVVGMVAAGLSDRGGEAGRVDVATGTSRAVDPPGAPAGDRGDADDPASVGLPRLALAAPAGMHLRLATAPVVQALPVEPSTLTQVQVIHPPGALLPLVVAPWSPAGAEQDLPVPGEDGSVAVEVGGIAAALVGEPPGWSVLSWSMADGTRTYLSSHGVGRDDLLAVARGLSRSPGGVAGYRVDHVPAGFAQELATLEPSGGTTSGYATTYVDRGGVEVATLTVRHEGDGRFVERLTGRLAAGSEIRTVEALGRPALLTRLGTEPPSRWSVLWQPSPGVTAELELVAADRATADGLVAALDQPGRQAWVDLVAAARG